MAEDRADEHYETSTKIRHLITDFEAWSTSDGVRAEPEATGSRHIENALGRDRDPIRRRVELRQ